MTDVKPFRPALPALAFVLALAAAPCALAQDSVPPPAVADPGRVMATAQVGDAAPAAPVPVAGSGSDILQTLSEDPASGLAGNASDNAQRYCTNIADAAADARYARQAAELARLEAQIDERIKALEAKRAEYEQWLTRREEFLRKADESLVAIFTQMRPDAASQQMSVMSLDAAAAILVKLNPRSASAILNEMDAVRAAQLTTGMAGLARPKDGKETPG